MSLALHELAWTAHARCADQPSDLFYVDRRAHSADRDAALALCNDGAGCPARRQCLAYAIANAERDGIWGGTTARARGDFARSRCPSCWAPLGRPLIAAMVLNARQHARCPRCGALVEAIPPWESPHRNSWVTGTGRRT